MAFTDAFDMAVTIIRQLQAILNQSFLLSVKLSRFSSFDVLSESLTTTEKRLMTDIQTVTKPFENEDLYIVAFICF